MLALDNSMHSAYALESVLERPWPDNSEFLVYAVYEPYHPDFAGWDETAVEQAVLYARRLEEELNNYAASCAKRLQEKFKGCKVFVEVSESARIKESIIEKAESWNCQLLVMGSHGRTGLQRFLLGSVSQAVVAHAPCSVEIIKRPHGS
ncbi:MAG: universal stress protein [Candidatus Obscuribacterales bacterium]|nr:universal stress protein [Candidatus Obscuribacterales bacterium]